MYILFLGEGKFIFSIKNNKTKIKTRPIKDFNKVFNRDCPNDFDLFILSCIV